MNSSFPDNLQQNIIVEVYLPKNLLNYGKLIEVLTEVLEFDKAKKHLVNDLSDVFNSSRTIFKLPEQYFDIILENAPNIIQNIFETNEYEIDKETKAEKGNENYLKIGSKYKIKLETNNDGTKICSVLVPSIWRTDFSGEIAGPENNRLKEASTYIKEFLKLKIENDMEKILKVSGLGISESEPKHILGVQDVSVETLQEFQRRVNNLEKTIEGYSIYEVDGAFEQNNDRKIGVEHKDLTISDSRVKLIIQNIRERKYDEVINILVEHFKKDFELFKFDSTINKFKIDDLSTKKNIIKSFFKLKRNIELNANHCINFNNNNEIDIRDNNNNKLFDIIINDENLSVLGYDLIITDNNYTGNSEVTESWKVTLNGEEKFIIVKEMIRVGDIDKMVLKFIRNIAIIEERVLVVRFIIPTNPEKDIKKYKYNKKQWDTLYLVGQYFVKRLADVGIEAQIWVTCNAGNLWIWEKGKPVDLESL